MINMTVTDQWEERASTIDTMNTLGAIFPPWWEFIGLAAQNVLPASSSEVMKPRRDNMMLES